MLFRSLKIRRIERRIRTCVATLTVTEKNLSLSKSIISLYQWTGSRRTKKLVNIGITRGKPTYSPKKGFDKQIYYEFAHRETVYSFPKPPYHFRLNWEDAQMICQTTESHLITINDKHQLNIFKFGIFFTFIRDRSLVDGTFLIKLVFIGLKSFQVS